MGGMYRENDRAVAVLQGKRPMKCCSTRDSTACNGRVSSYHSIDVFGGTQARLSIIYCPFDHRNSLRMLH